MCGIDMDTDIDVGFYIDIDACTNLVRALIKRIHIHKKRSGESKDSKGEGLLGVKCSSRFAFGTFSVNLPFCERSPCDSFTLPLEISSREAFKNCRERQAP